MKVALVVLALLLAGCGKSGGNEHAVLLDKGCVFKSRGAVGKACSRYGCRDVIGTTYSCPAYEASVAD
jgi:hypothetical protein